MLVEVRNSLVVKAFSLCEVGSISKDVYNEIIEMVRDRFCSMNNTDILGIELADKQITEYIWFEVAAHQNKIKTHEHTSFSNECIQNVNESYIGERFVSI